MNVAIPGNVRLRTPDGRNCHRVSEHRFYLSPFERVQSSGFRYLRKIAPPQHDPASRRQDGGWRGRVGVPVAAPHTLAATGDLRPPRIRPRWHFHTNGRVRSVALHSRPRPRRPWSEPRRSSLKTAAAWGEHLFSTHRSTRVGVHPAFRLSRTPNVRAQVSCGGTFSSLAAYRERNSRVAG